MNYGQNPKSYKEQETLSASPGELIVLLYERLLLDLHKAERYLDRNDPPGIVAKTEALDHANSIVLKLLENVNLEEGGQIAESLVSLYGFFATEILQINLKNDVERLHRLQKMVSELTDAWKTIAHTPPTA